MSKKNGNPISLNKVSFWLNGGVFVFVGYGFLFYTCIVKRVRYSFGGCFRYDALRSGYTCLALRSA